LVGEGDVVGLDGVVGAVDVLAGAESVAGAGLGGQDLPEAGHGECQSTADEHGDQDSP
jgi:hypothetical protein